MFHSPFRNPLALSFSPYLRRIFRLRLARSYVRTFVTHTVSFALSLSLFLFYPPILSAFPFLAHSPLSLSRHRLSSFSLLSPTTRSQGSPPPHNLSCPSRPPATPMRPYTMPRRRRRHCRRHRRRRRCCYCRRHRRTRSTSSLLLLQSSFSRAWFC